MRKSHLLIICALAVLSPQLQQAQSADNSFVYSWFDQVVGQANTGIYNAVEYIEEHRTINEHHKFFLNEFFLPASVVYDGQPYYDVELKYNVYDDLLQVKVQHKNNPAIFQLLSEKVESFRIPDHSFINLQEQGGFHEVLLENEELGLYKKHRKSIKKREDEQFVYYEFPSEAPHYLLRYDQDFHRINSRRDILRIFPENKRIIREFYSSARSLRKSNPDAFFQQLFQLLSQSHIE